LPRGDGWVLLVAQATPFANRALGRADNARFAGNILRELVAPSGVVIFDDGLQGVPEPYDLGRLLADPRLHVSALALFALWLAWIVGGTRLRSPAPAPHPPGAAALVACWRAPSSLAKPRVRPWTPSSRDCRRAHVRRRRPGSPRGRASAPPMSPNSVPSAAVSPTAAESRSIPSTIF
jgi:hypothetical protein